MDDSSGGQYATDVLEEKYCVVFRADSLRHPQVQIIEKPLSPHISLI